MARTLGLSTLAAIVLAWSWLRLEHGTITWQLLAWLALVAILPALVPHRGLRLALVLPAALLGMLHVFGTLRPGRVRDDFGDGLLAYYDVALPFSAADEPLMHALVELAILGFTLAVSLAIAERRAVLAAGLLVAGAVWPATLLTSSNTVGRGAVVLAAALAIVAGLSATARLRQAGLAGALVIVAAVTAAGIPAVAKGAFVPWETWEPEKPVQPVSVSYVWQTTYQALEWPDKRTTVFTVEAPPYSRYWRATTLDVFNGGFWLETTQPMQPLPIDDPLMPADARNPERQLEARFTMEALGDKHLLGASIPVRYDAEGLGPVFYDPSGNAIVQGGVPQGAEYRSWSYAARPTPRELSASRPVYPSSLDRYLAVEARTSTPTWPRFGSPSRLQDAETIFQQNFGARRYRELYDQAMELAGDAPTPYAAVVAVESFFRDTQNFTYDQNPVYRGNEPTLVEFVTENRRGYCQHFAGAMALMLRYLGIPARVAAGFTSGSYNQERGRWTVTDHDAHLWVEVWFRGHGWLPFDPTPGRGRLDGAYSTASINFNAAALAAAVAATAGTGTFRIDQAQFERIGRPDRGQAGDVPGDFGSEGGGRTAEQSLLRLLVIVGFALLLAVAVLKLAVRRARYATRDPRRIAAACRRELADFLLDQRVAVPESATLTELGRIVREETGVDPRRFVEALDTARYAPPELAGDAARRARGELRRVERVLRQRLSAWERFRGLVSLRSLGLTGA